MKTKPQKFFQNTEHLSSAERADALEWAGIVGQG